MAYLAVEDVQAEFRSVTFSATTAVTSDMVAEFIDQEEALLNAKLAKKYSVPITAAESLKIVTLLATWYVKARILSILYVKSEDDKVDQGANGTSLRKQADDLVAQIMKETVKLSDATLAESSDGVKDFVSSDPCISMKFLRDTKQW